MSNVIHSYLSIDDDFIDIKVLEKFLNLITQEDVHLTKVLDYYEMTDLDSEHFIKIMVSLNTIRNDLSLTKLSLIVVPYYDEKLVKFLKVDKNGVNYLFDILFSEMDINSDIKPYFQKIFSKVPDDIIKTIKCYTNFNGSVRDVSEAMFTHRNTINYRINRFIQLTSIDIRQLENIALIRWLFSKLGY